MAASLTGLLHSEQEIQVIGSCLSEWRPGFCKHSGQRGESSPEEPTSDCGLHESKQAKREYYSDDAGSGDYPVVESLSLNRDLVLEPSDFGCQLCGADTRRFVNPQALLAMLSNYCS